MDQNVFLIFLLAIVTNFKNSSSETEVKERKKFQNLDFIVDLARAQPNVEGIAGTGTLLSV